MDKTRCSSKVLDMHNLAEYKPPIPRGLRQRATRRVLQFNHRDFVTFFLFGCDAAFALGGCSVRSYFLKALVKSFIAPVSDSVLALASY